MCVGCWEEEGSPSIVNERVVATAELLKRCHSYGACHIVVEDWNLEDEHIEHCLSEPQIDADEIAAMNALQALSLEERYSAMAICEGLLTP